MTRRKKAKPRDDTFAGDRSSRGTRRHFWQACAHVTLVSPSARAARRLNVLGAGLMVLAAVAAYHNSFAGTFIYDDLAAISENQTIRHLWPIGRVLSPPENGETVAGRPLLNLSLAVNYALDGLEVRGYHAANLAIHTAAALLLMGILRRTFLTPALRDRLGGVASPLALACALIWTVHPLQTESVTYIIQRAESLAGLCYLLTLYCVIRGAGSAGLWPAGANAGGTPALQWPGEKGDCPLWYAAAVLACLLGMATKEVIVTAPLIVFLYDRTFLAGSFREALRRRWGLYVSLAATWGLLAYLVFSTGLIGRQSELGSPGLWSYARTQPGVVLHYLRLTVWPHPLCLDYVWPVASGFWEVFPGVAILGLLAAITVWGLRRRTAWSFLGAWFFLILAPTSSVFPLAELAFEHRMYLPSAAVVVLAVAGGYVLWDRWLPHLTEQGGQSPFSPETIPGGSGLSAAKKGTVPGVVRGAVPAAVLLAVLLALGCTTVARNRDYQSSVAFWQDTVKKRPHSYFAPCALGNALAASGRTEEAIQQYRRSLQLKPDYPAAYRNLSSLLVSMGRVDEAIQQYEQALRLRPNDGKAHNNLGLALAGLGRSAEAIDHYQKALLLKPDYAEAQYNLAGALATVGRTKEAIEHYNQFLRLAPDSIEVIDELAWLLASHAPAEGGDPARAVELAERARGLAGEENIPCLDTLAAAYAAAGRFDDAAIAAQRAVQLAESAGQASLAKLIRDRLERYRAGRPYREASKGDRSCTIETH